MVAREVGGWVAASNVYTLMSTLSRFVGYSFDKLDWTAVATSLPETDAEAADQRYEYPLVGEPSLDVSLAVYHGADPVAVTVNGDLDDVLSARIETLLDVLADIWPASDPDRDRYGGRRDP